MMHFHFVNAKQAFKAKVSSNPDKLGKSGIRTLEARMFKMSSEGTRRSILLNDLEKICKDLGFYLKEIGGDKVEWPILEFGNLLFECKKEYGEEFAESMRSYLQGES